MDILTPHKEVLYINSVNRKSGTSSDFIYDISTQVDSDVNYDTIILTACSIPKSYYLINTLNSTFMLIEDGIQYTVTLPIGNYTFTALSSQLQTSLNLYGTHTYSVSASYLTGKFVFTVVGGTVIQFDFRPVSTEIHEIIGFEDDIYTFTLGSLTSVNMVNLQLTNVIQVNCSDVGGSNSILSEVIPNSNSFDTILYNEQNPSYISKKYNYSANMRLWINDQNGRLLDLNGLNWQCVIVLYKSNDYYNKSIIDKRLKLLREESEAGVL